MLWTAAFEHLFGSMASGDQFVEYSVVSPETLNAVEWFFVGLQYVNRATCATFKRRLSSAFSFLSPKFSSPSDNARPSRTPPALIGNASPSPSICVVKYDET
jgi:hypothetical protein